MLWTSAYANPAKNTISGFYWGAKKKCSESGGHTAGARHVPHLQPFHIVDRRTNDAALFCIWTEEHVARRSSVHGIEGLRSQSVP